MKDEILKQVLSLLRFYPGRSKWAWVWLFVIPLGLMAIYYLVFSYLMRVQVSQGHYGLFLAAGEIPFYCFALSVLLTAFRVGTSSHSNFREPFIKSVSSTIYAIILFVIAALVIWIWGAVVYSVFLVSIIQVLLSILFLCAICLGTATLAGWLAYHIPILVPLTILILLIISWITPINYELNMILDRLPWFIWCPPITAVIDIFRNGIFNSTPTVSSSWGIAIIYAVLGCGITYFGWKYSSKLREHV